METSRRNFLKSSGSVLVAGAVLSSPVLSAFSQAAKANPINTLPEIVTWGARELSTKIHSKQVSCVEVMHSYLAHIEKVNPIANAIVSIKPPEECIKEAKYADELLAKGEDKGWMHGMPQAIKDLSNTKDILTSQGSPLFAQNYPKEDGLMVSRMRNAGSLIIGKTNTPEFGLGSHTYNQVFGATKNAYDPTKCAGGSSGGAAVALALRMLPVADGSDMMGSLRNPAAYNNIFGFRPSQGRVPMYPAADLFSGQLGYEGPMGRTVGDLAWLLSTQAGYDVRVPLSLEGDPLMYRQNLETNLSGKKIAYLGNFNDYLPMEAGILELCETALKQVANFGMQVDMPKLELAPENIWKTWLTLRHYSVGNGLKSFYNDPSKRALLKPEAIWEIEGSLQLSSEDVYKANVMRSQIFSAMNQLFKDFEYIVLPTAQVFPFDVNQHWPKMINDQPMDTYHRWMEVVTLATLSGCPTLSVPVGFNAQGLPMGMQIIGKPRSDLSVLQFGHAYEAEQSWTKSHMPALIR